MFRKLGFEFMDTWMNRWYRILRREGFRIVSYKLITKSIIETVISPSTRQSQDH